MSDEKSQSSPTDIASLAIQILQLAPEKVWPRIGNIHDRTHDRDFQAALERARWLLKNAPANPDEPVHAYQLFTEGREPQSPESVAKIFSEVKWGAGLTSGVSVNEVVRDILKRANVIIDKENEQAWEKLYAAKTGLPLNIPAFADEVEGYVKKIICRLGFELILTDSNKISKRVVSMIGGEAILRLGRCSEDELKNNALDPNYRKDFIQYVAPNLESPHSRMFRPYEVFLFAAQNSLFKQKLVRKRGVLDPNFVPNPSVDASTSILYSHLGFRPDKNEVPTPS